MKSISQDSLLNLLIAGARERRYMETQRQMLEKLKEMEAEERARRARQQYEAHRAYYLSFALKRGPAPSLRKPLQH